MWSISSSLTPSVLFSSPDEKSQSSSAAAMVLVVAVDGGERVLH